MISRTSSTPFASIQAHMPSSTSSGARGLKKVAVPTSTADAVVVNYHELCLPVLPASPPATAGNVRRRGTPLGATRWGWARQRLDRCGVKPGETARADSAKVTSKPVTLSLCPGDPPRKATNIRAKPHPMGRPRRPIDRAAVRARHRHASPARSRPAESRATGPHRSRTPSGPTATARSLPVVALQRFGSLDPDRVAPWCKGARRCDRRQ